MASDGPARDPRLAQRNKNTTLPPQNTGEDSSKKRMASQSPAGMPHPPKQLRKPDLVSTASTSVGNGTANGSSRPSSSSSNGAQMQAAPVANMGQSDTQTSTVSDTTAMLMAFALRSADLAEAKIALTHAQNVREKAVSKFDGMKQHFIDYPVIKEQRDAEIQVSNRIWTAAREEFNRKEREVQQSASSLAAILDRPKRAPSSGLDKREIGRLDARIAKVEKDLEKTNSGHDANKLADGPDVAALQGDISSLEATLDSLQKRIDALEGGAHAAPAPAPVSTGFVPFAPVPPPSNDPEPELPWKQKIEGEINSLQVWTASIDQQYKNLTTEEVVRSMCDQMSAMYPDAKNCQVAVNNVSQQVEALKSDLAELKNIVNGMPNGVAQSGSDTSGTDLTSFKAQVNKALSDGKQKLSDLTSTVENAKGDIVNLQSGLKRAITEAVDRHEELKKRVDSMDH